MPYKNVLIVGAGAGLSASLARKFSARGATVDLAARNAGKLAELAAETGAVAHMCDASQTEQVNALFEALDAADRTPDLVVYNASARTRGPLEELEPDAVLNAITVSAFAGFLVGQQAARRMTAAGHGTILFTGASASVKGYPQSAPFAMGKFALRGLAQSMARELHPKGVHVAHVVIDGAIKSATGTMDADSPDSLLDPDAIADSYLALADQHRSAWSWEIEIRPWVESF